jgi:peroxiredoxin
VKTVRRLGWGLVVGWAMFWLGWHLRAARLGPVVTPPTAAATRLEAVLPTPGPTGPGAPLDGVPVPAVRLVAADGRTIDLRGLGGHVMVLAFVDPRGGDETARAAAVVRAAWADLGGKAAGAVALAVGVRPEGGRQSPPAASEAPWQLLVGPPDALRRVLRAYHVTVETVGSSVAYTPAVVVVDRRGRSARLLILSAGVSAADQGAALAQVVRTLLGSAAGSH